MRLARLVGLAGVAAMIACSNDGANLTTPGGTGGSQSAPSDQTIGVAIQDFTYSPATVNVKVGATVVWTNGGPSAHTTVSDDGTWSSGSLNPPNGGGMYGGANSPAGTFQFTFNQAGTFRYHCSIHPPSAYPGFTGAVVVSQ
jgi:plastocyanin